MPSVIAVGSSRVHLSDLLAESYLEDAQRLRNLDRIDEAEAILRGAIQCFPGNPDLLFDYAFLAEERGDAPAALARWQKVQAASPGPAEVIRRIFEGRIRLQQTAEPTSDIRHLGPHDHAESPIALASLYGSRAATPKIKSMHQTLHLLASAPVRRTGDRIPLRWSEVYKRTLDRIAANQIASSPVDVALAPSLLRAAEGHFVDAERGILEVLSENISLCTKNDGIFVSLLCALFCVQRFDFVSAMLRDLNTVASEFEIDAQPDGFHRSCIQWELPAHGPSRFIFDVRVFETDDTRLEPLKLHWMFPLYAHYMDWADREIGKIVLNHSDIGIVPGLAWCDNRPDRFLVPDSVFTSTRGYRHARQTFAENHISWHDRKLAAFWRGSTTGMRASPTDWRSLPRIRLCELARDSQRGELIDAGITSVVQFDAPDVDHEIAESGLMRDTVPWQEWNQYRYHIDIDGNTNAWSGLFQRLLTGSPVLKVESSQAMVQWYYDRLVPWHNYVPVASDMSDLVDKIHWLTQNEALSESIGQRGRELADELSFEREMDRGAHVISEALRYLSSGKKAAGPYVDRGRSRDNRRFAKSGIVHLDGSPTPKVSEVGTALGRTLSSPVDFALSSDAGTALRFINPEGKIGAAVAVRYEQLSGQGSLQYRIYDQQNGRWYEPFRVNGDEHPPEEPNSRYNRHTRFLYGFYTPGVVEPEKASMEFHCEPGQPVFQINSHKTDHPLMVLHQYDVPEDGYPIILVRNTSGGVFALGRNGDITLKGALRAGGAVVVDAAVTEPKHAATKAYVDNALGSLRDEIARLREELTRLRSGQPAIADQDATVPQPPDPVE